MKAKVRSRRTDDDAIRPLDPRDPMILRAKALLRAEASAGRLGDDGPFASSDRPFP